MATREIVVQAGYGAVTALSAAGEVSAIASYAVAATTASATRTVTLMANSYDIPIVEEVPVGR